MLHSRNEIEIFIIEISYKNYILLKITKINSMLLGTNYKISN